MSVPARVRVATTDEEIQSCFALMAELRPHVRSRGFIARIRRQQAAGYRLAYLNSRGRPCCLAGYRVSECLMWGRFLYVDDLVTTASARAQGWGARMFDWLVAEARREGCGELHLDSGVHRFGAHRFYLARRMDITCHHFALRLG